MAAPLALVTGGCRRLGAAIAARLAADGWALALHGHADAEPEAALTDVLAVRGSEWHGFVADFADPASATDLFAAVCERFGHAPALLVNNASLFGQDRLGETSADDLARHQAVNVAAPVLLVQAFAAAAGGEGDRSIVNMLDQRLAQPHPDQLAYTLSKYALAGLTQVAARALAPAIRVNAVAPGLTLPTGDYRDAQVAALAKEMPLARLPDPAAIADAVAYLARATAVTGEVLHVDAGARLVPFSRDFMHLA